MALSAEGSSSSFSMTSISSFSGLTSCTSILRSEEDRRNVVFSRRWVGPERWRLEGARTRHQRPCRRPLRPERAALALWATPVHASSMVESTADDHLTVNALWMSLSALSHRLHDAEADQVHFRYATALRCANLQRHRRQQGCRRLSSTPSSWRAQALPTRPVQPSLASVGGGMAAGAAFAHPRAADVGSVRSFSTLCNANDPMTHATSRQCAMQFSGLLPMMDASRALIAAKSSRHGHGPCSSRVCSPWQCAMQSSGLLPIICANGLFDKRCADCRVRRSSDAGGCVFPGEFDVFVPIMHRCGRHVQLLFARFKRRRRFRCDTHCVPALTLVIPHHRELH